MPYVSDDNKTNHVNTMCLAFQSNRKAAINSDLSLKALVQWSLFQPSLNRLYPKNVHLEVSPPTLYTSKQLSEAQKSAYNIQ